MAARCPRPPWCSPRASATRMRPITETLPKPLIEVAGRTLIDHCLDRFAENGVERAIVNVHWLRRPDRGASGAAQRAANRHFRRARAAARPGRRHQEGAAADRRRAVLRLQYRRVLDRGAALESASGSPRPSIPRRWTRSCWSPPSARRGRRRLARRFHDGRGTGGSTPREPRHVAPFVYTGVGIIKPELFDDVEEDVFRLAPFFFARGRARAAVRRCGSTACGCMSGGRRSIAEAETGDRPVDSVSGLGAAGPSAHMDCFVAALLVTRNYVKAPRGSPGRCGAWNTHRSRRS